MLHQERKVYYLERPRKERKLPEVLSEDQIKKLIESTTNLKHKSIIMIMYSAGVRIGELLKLRKQDILAEKKIIFVRKGKRNRDRITLLADSTMEIL